MRSATASTGKSATKSSADGGIASNPFAEFAASAPPAAATAAREPKRAAASLSSGGGWMTTKKRGRDDAVIEKDKRAALAARKRQSGRNAKLAPGAKGDKSSNNNKKKSKKKTAKGRKRYYDSESEESFEGYDDVSEDDFIVDDDEEVEGGQSMSSATEDEINSPPPLPSRRAAALRASKRLVEEKKADDGDEEEFAGGGRGSSSEDDYSEANTDDADDDDADDDDDYDTLDILPSKKKHKSAATEALSTTSKYFSVPKKKSAGAEASSAASSFRRGMFDSSDESSENSSDDTASCDRETKTTKMEYDSNESDRNGTGGKMSPEKPFGFKSKKNNGKKFLKKRDKNSSTWVNAVADARYADHEDDFMDSDDDDEQIALGLALSESLMKENKNGVAGRKKLGGAKKAARKKKDKQKQRRRVTVELSPLSPSEPAPIGSDEDDDDGNVEEILAEDFEVDDDEVDAYEEANESEREAEKVLRVANDLSGKVLLAMKAWSPSHALSADTSTEGEKIFVPEGMIVDDALALSTLTQLDVQHDTSNTTMSSTASAAVMAGGDSASGPSKHKWISHEEMQEICPGLKLADFQLIGVNWLALLHSMECDVDGIGDKKNKRGGIGQKMNVNGVLADEMGCGKTVQTIAFLAWLKHRNASSKAAAASSSSSSSQVSVNALSNDNDSGDEVVVIGDSDSECDSNSNSGGASHGVTAKVKCASPTAPHIIIVPASVLTNWQREFTKFCPSMKVVKYHGSMQEREELQEEMNAKYLSKQGRKAKEQLDIVLTTFSYFSKEKSDDRSFLRKFNFQYMVVDEAHQLKNPKGLRYKNMDKFRTSHRLLLTGTPIQNSPKELMSLLCFLMPLFSKQASAFDDAENDGGARMLEYFVTLQGGKGTDPRDAYKKLKQLLSPFCLRRRKNECLGQIMPKKTRETLVVPFDQSTRRVYDAILEGHIKAKMKGQLTDDAATQNHLFTSLRKAANHPLLLRTRHTSDQAVEHLVHQTHMYGYWGNVETITDKKELIRRELASFSDFDIHCMVCELIEENPTRAEEMDRYKLTESDLFCSPKCRKLQSLLLELIEAGHRMLIFSQWTRCLDLLGCLLESMDLDYLRIDGSTKVAERQDLMDRFNESNSIPVFLLSTRAGGMGINLTGADTCIIHDLDFNPFNDLQAEDRCHRIGQKKPVTVYKMITENTVDSDIHALQEKKAAMNAAIIGIGDLSQSDSKAEKKNEAEDISGLLQKQLRRFSVAHKGTAGKSADDDNSYL